MEFLSDYGLFLAKFVTVCISSVLVIGIVIALLSRQKDDIEQLEIKHINDKYDNMRLLLNSRLLDKKALKTFQKERKQKQKESPDTPQKKLFVIHFKGDIKASRVSSLREIITAILTVVAQDDAVLVTIESGGGTVHGYGLAASQLRRLRDKGIQLTAAVDKVAASGGYMMACVADKIIAAPFAIIGSIGVLAQIPNFHRLLKKMDIDFEQITAGDYKRTLTLFGENTDADREKFKQELEDTHVLFKEFVKENRTQVDIEAIATGEHWYGKRAIEKKLVDELITSDDYLFSASDDYAIYEVSLQDKKALSEKLLSLVNNAMERIG